MKSIFGYELKSGLKTLFIWALAVGGMGFVCLLLFDSMKGSMEGMAENFASMGAFSEAFGMSKLSIATVAGYFATEIGTIHSLGSSMFAASISIIILSKEEDGHTAEFTYTLPLSRLRVIICKAMALLTEMAAFTVICTGFYILGFVILGEKIPAEKFATFILLQLMMNIEIAAVCFAISAAGRHNRMGLGIGVSLIMYFLDIMARITKDAEKIGVISPFSYANATDVFAGDEINFIAFAIGAAVIIVSALTAVIRYTKKDLSA